MGRGNKTRDYVPERFRVQRFEPDMMCGRIEQSNRALRHQALGKAGSLGVRVNPASIFIVY